MTQTRIIHLTAIAAAAGGAFWLVKIAVIAATDGAVDGTGAVAAAVLYLLGVALLAVGAATMTLRLARDRGTWAIAAACLAAPIVFFVSYVLLEGIAQGLVGDTDPVWLGEEVGIAVTGACWLAAGGALARAAASSRERMR